MFSPNLEWPEDPQAAGLVGSVGSWLNEGVSMWCSVVFCGWGRNQRQTKSDEGSWAGKVKNHRRRREEKRQK